MTGASGYAGKAYLYDEKGNLIEETYLDPDGSRLGVDAAETASGQEYPDEEALSENLAESEETETDDSSGLQEKSSDEEASENGQYASVRYSYDENGNRTETAYFDEADHPVLGADGYASMRREYDENGFVLQESYFDTEGNPVTASGGYASVSYERDQRGNALETRWYDENGQPVEVKGAARAVAAYDL